MDPTRGAQPNEQHPTIEDAEYSEVGFFNEIEVRIGRNELYHNFFVIYFPQIKLGDERAKKEPRVKDQALILGNDPEEAKLFFRTAAKKAHDVDDAYDLYRVMKKFEREHILKKDLEKSDF